jgi:glycosyltransferase involved in cell wall biosynthesis
VEQTLFHAERSCAPAGRFTIFSGGKFEYRKGQDLVLCAIKALQVKYKDIYFINAWSNQWGGSTKGMAQSPYIKFEYAGSTWDEFMRRIYAINGMPTDRIITLPLLQQEKIPQVYHRTDIGVFPNRCEGGTNLVMMEYMACGKPVVATFGTGHTDVLRDENAYLLKNLRNVEVADLTGAVIGRWLEPKLEDLIASLEYAYWHREEAHQKGVQAAEDMKQYTWARAAQVVIDALKNLERAV